MELLYYLVFTFCWKMSSSIHCYKCEPEDNYDGFKLCDNFDGSDAFITECQKSNMCFKRETTLEVNGMTTVSVTRGCAPQTLKGDQEKKNGKWRPKNTIYDVYEDGCKEDPNNVDKPAKTINCYCSGDLCNTSNKNYISSILFLVPMINFLR